MTSTEADRSGGAPRQDQHFFGDFPAVGRGRPSTSLTSPTETPAPSPFARGEGTDTGISTSSPISPRPLVGLRVAVTRSADRAGALVAALAAAGAEPVLVPLIDFEIAEQDVLGDALRRLAAGDYAWLVISSITTVRALKQWCDGAGTALAQLIPAGTKVATIGPTSTAVLAAEGVQVDLAPTDIQSAAGLVDLWPEGSGRVLLPQSNLAQPTLVDGLGSKGWVPEIAVAYRTVDYPAAPALRLTATLAATAPGTESASSSGPAGAPLSPADAAAEVQAGRLGAVVIASGSAAERVAATLAPLPASCLLVAIGEPTRVTAVRLGLAVAATAAHPTPAGIVAALAGAYTAANLVTDPAAPEQESL